MRTKEQVIERIKELGLKKGFVARQCGIGLATFSLYLKGERTIRKEQSERLNKFLDERR